MFNRLFYHFPSSTLFKRLALIALVLVLLVALLVAVQPTAAQTQPWMNTSLPPVERANLLLAAMTQAEKLTMVHGGGASSYVGHTDPITRLGIPALNMNDGPSGVGNGKTNVTAFPAPITLAAAWNTNLAEQYGVAMGQEFLGKGANVALAPMMNMVRVPQAGRNFEGFGEDPYLAAEMSYYEIVGIQNQGVIATAKHYIDNEQEIDRNSVSSDVDERTQHEIYLPPFAASVRANAGAMMCAYNRVNGVYACENAVTQNQFLKGELAYQGWMMSDWGATHSTVASANNGLDMEMPGSTFFGSALTNAISSGQVSQAQFDNMVRRILTSMFAAGLFDRPPTGSPTADVRSAAHTQVARDVATQGLVLLKNANNALPLNSATIDSIAVIGSAASTNPIVVGGGSGYVNPPYVITPLQGITARAGSGVDVTYTEGGTATGTVVPSQVLRTPGGATGLQGQYFNNTTLSGTPVLTRTDTTINFNWNSGSPGTGVNATNWSARWTGTLTPPTSGSYVLMLTSDDGSRLYINNNLVVNNWGDHASTTVSATINLTGGTAYSLRVEYYQAGGSSNMQFAWLTPTDTAFSAAINAAQAADVAVVVVGLTSSEGSDRPNLNLPGTQDALVSAVAGANPRTIVVAYAPAQILMPWAGEAEAILFSGMPGQETGNALADVLFGVANPSGKLPMTIAQATDDYPANTPEQYPGVNGHAAYSEGLEVGYRHFDANNIAPLYPFGHGLSYTTFGYSNLSVTPSGGSAPTQVNVALDVTNTGSRAGAEVVQVYIGYPSAAGEPPKGLKAFRKVNLSAGQTQRITMTLTPGDWSYWNTASHSWAVAAGTYQVMVGSSSRDIRLTGSFTATEGTPPPTTPPPTTPPPTTPPPTDNLAQGRPVVCSSEEAGGYSCPNAVDGNTSTRWSSAFSDPQWITVDLGATYSVDRVVLIWEAAYGRSYQIQVAGSAGGPWTNIYSTTSGNGGTDDLVVSGSGRYVRMYGTARATSWGYSLFEFQVYGGGTPPPTTPPPTTPPPTTPPPTTPPPTTQPGQAPYGGTPWAVPGTIQAENYDTGGEGVAYHDTTSGNSGSSYRDDAVDIQATSDTGGGYNVGWTAAGEWLEYTITVTSTGTYTLNARVAAPSAGSSIHAEIDGANVTGAMSIPATGAWQTWTTVTSGSFSLSAGQHVLRIAEDTAGFNINWVSLASGTTTPPPTTPPPTTPPPTTPPPPTNLALSRPVTCSSVENAGTACANAVDGSTGTRWASAFSDPQWIYVDLGATRTLSSVTLRWETAYGRAFQIQVSGNASTWSTLYSTSTGTGGVQTIPVSGSGRYVRMYGTTRATGWGYSLWEFEIYGY